MARGLDGMGHSSAAFRMSAKDRMKINVLKAGFLIYKGGFAAVQVLKSHSVALSTAVKDVTYAGTVISVISLFGTFISARENIRNLKNSELGKRVRLIPLALLMVNIGDVVSLINQAKSWVAEAIHKGASALPVMSTATTILGTTMIALQALSLTVDAFEFRSLFKQSKAFKGKQPGQSGSFDRLTVITGTPAEQKTNPKTGKKIYKSPTGTGKLFDAFSNQQKGLIDDINKQGVIGKSDRVVKMIEHRFKFLKGMKALGIAIGIISIVGIALLTFAPTPLAPVAWAIVGTTVALAISRMISMIVVQHRLTKQLESVKNEV